ncbi:hypothetical protein EUX98_g5554 [Antrodiella citrinella]|uniref:2-amino-4-hydroxy-6-hydroxymethyldihydropteridine diphosphokinase n=1 Tax=Antrodiella citrinella TaxID=2447956 RepID=A0A4S4MTF5_9APHY|nr:hypothetical protein EUX98_g5554 [Antrodiella citrinella]
MAGTNAPDSLDVIRVKNLQVMAFFSDGAQWLSDTAKLQPVQITLDIAYDVSGAAAADDLTQSINYSDVCKTLTSTATSQTFASLEDLCSTSSEEETDVKTAALALGSNLGDRFTNIEVALRVLETPGVHYNGLSADAFVNVVNTSFMYETEPMYVSDQPKFINCACMLLTLVKRVEVIVGRVVSFRNGPRAIDLDVLLYSTRTVDTRPTNSRSLSAEHLEGHLVVPHPRMLEREFVLRPLNDMIPGYIHPVAKCSIRSLFSDLINIQPADTPLMNKVTPFPRYPFCGPDTPSEPESSQLPRISPVPPTATYWKYPVVSSTSLPTKALPKRKTYIMGTLNVTPDSFSDGAVNNTIPAALRYAQLAAEAGADILDVGGYSTRPGAEHVTPEEEFTRVVPVIQAIRTQFQQGALGDPSRELLISVDTFRWEVAEEAVHAGANCINDVYAFRGPGWPVDASSDENFAKMKQVARELVVPVVLMHSRGVPSANKDYSEYAYVEDSSTVEGVRVELGARVESIVKGKAGYPMLVGASRKSFLGLLLENPDEEGSYAGRQTKADGRDFATAGAIAWAVQSKAEIVRVHNVEGLGDVVRITSAIMG